MAKQIKVKVVYYPTSGWYEVTQLVNAAVLSFKGQPLIIGSNISARDIDEFARNRSWQVTIDISKGV